VTHYCESIAGQSRKSCGNKPLRNIYGIQLVWIDSFMERGIFTALTAIREWSSNLKVYNQQNIRNRLSFSKINWLLAQQAN